MGEPMRLYLELLWIPATCGYGLLALGLTVFDWLKRRRTDDELLERYDFHWLSTILFVLTINAMIWLASYCALDGVRQYGLNDHIHGTIAGMALFAALFLAGSTCGRIARMISVVLIELSFVPLVFLQGTVYRSFDCLAIPTVIGLFAVHYWLWHKAAPQAGTL